jgi:hypothetical protein
VPADCAYDYAIVRLVPRVDRGETINVGVILSCPERDFLAARIELDEARIRALDAGFDVETAPMRDRSASCPPAPGSTGWWRRGAR